MVNIISAIVTFLVLMLPIHSFGDTIILKNGRAVDATKCWGDGNLFKCRVYRQVIGFHKSYIAEMRQDSAPEMPAKGFKFDTWQSGISVRESINIAEDNEKLGQVRSGFTKNDKSKF